MEGIKNMKRICFLLLGVALMLCVSCTKLSEEKGHIYRDDIEVGDFAFLFDEWEHEPGKTDKEIGLELYNALRRDTIKLEDIFDALGLPTFTTDDYGMISYTYTIGNEVDTITIKYIPDKDEIDLIFGVKSIESEEDEENLIMIWSKGDRTIDREQYRMHKRFDINESELSFINKSATSEEVQQTLGAPHYYIDARETQIERIPGNAFVYELASGNVLKFIYYRQGYIIRAWIEDKDGKQIKLFIDRDIKGYYEETGYTM